jgi:hypothetical protein
VTVAYDSDMIMWCITVELPELNPPIVRYRETLEQLKTELYWYTARKQHSHA